MEKSKFMLRVDADILKNMKIFAIEQNMPLNEILIRGYEMLRIYEDVKINKEDLFSIDEIEDDDIPF